MRTRRLLPLLASAVALLACPAAASAGVTEFTTGLIPGGEPADITTGPDGNLWFTQQQGAIGSITPTGAITEYPAGLTPGLPLGRSPRHITAGPDGALWFTVQGNADAIARLDPATGAVVEFRLRSSREPTGITAGPDGNLWFTERGARKIGRITTDGDIDEFAAGLDSKDLVNDIAAGHDGKLWFTVEGEADDDDDDARTRAAGGPKIGRIDPSTGIVSHFTSGLTGATPNQIVSASDGRLYFSDSGTPGAIRRISTNGAIKTYRTGLTAGSQPTGIAEGGDGALWFTAGADPGRLGRLWRATSTITEFAGGGLPNFTADAHPRGITRGPDGNVWFTERDYPGRIGRMTVPPLADLELETLPGSSAKHEAPAVLQATIAANSQTTTFHLEYGPDEDYGSTTAELAAGAGATPVQRVVDLPLTPGSHLHVRVVATNGSGQSVSDDVALWVGANGEILDSEPPAPGPVTSNAPATATPGVPTVPTVPTGEPGTGAVAPPAPPKLGQDVVIRPVSGAVRFKAPGAAGYSALGDGLNVPVGSLIDTRKGRVSLQSARDARGRTQTGTFWGAVFQVRQRRHGRGVTDIVLRNGNFSRCGALAGASALAREAGGKRRVVRRLWGKDRHARFRTHGRDSVATVRGTKWVTTDRCDGTLTKVTEGKVLVDDLHRKRNVLLTAGRAYLARHARR